jgi:cellulose synthase/poly-beta-1,6-N-acetylglucosamine synthase-like glycosyltransferase
MKTFFSGAAVAAIVLVAGMTDADRSTWVGRSTSVEAQLPAPAQTGPPELPRVTVDTSEPRITGRTMHVAAGEDLQRAIDDAQPGDRITLQPGAIYKGPFRLRPKNGDGWIVITSAATDLPKPGRHVTPADAARMPKLVASTGAVIEAQPGAHHFRLVGLEITAAEGVALNTLVQLGDDASRLELVPHHVIIDRCYIHGDPKLGGRRGVALNSSHTAVIDSYISDFKERTVDAQAIAGWNGPGPFRIAGNYLEASGENIMFGGADPDIRDLVPADIEIVRNHLTKPLRWKKDDPAFEGTEWAVKNLFELKNARRVLVEGNLLEHNWPHAQNGFAILFTVRNQDGGAPWSVVEDVTFRNNLVRHVAAGVNVLGRDDNHPSEQTRRIAIVNNVFEDVGGAWGNGRLFQLLNGTSAITIEHNTAEQTGNVLFAGDSEPHAAFVFRNNLIPHNEHGITGSGTGPGTQTLQRFFPNGVFAGNVLIGAPAGSYPSGNSYPKSLAEARLGAQALASGSRPPGADVGAIEKALGGLATVTRIHAQLPRRQLPMIDGVMGAGLGIGTSGVGSFAELVFWLSFVLLVYVYFGYPAIAALRTTLRPRPHLVAPMEPTVSIVVVAYNEAERIGARIENLLALDYPADRREIVVASDGSTDATVERAGQYTDAGVTVRPLAMRRGKAAVLGTIVPGLRGDIVVFADARQQFDADTLRALVDNFADPGVGAVSGELVLATRAGTGAAGHGTAFYWRYETFIRSAEARSDSTIGATGAIYAIRRGLFEPIPDDTILDDVLIPLRIVRRGFRVLFEPRARAYDWASTTAGQEFARKARTTAGTFQLFARERWLFNPWRNRLWFETMSHKALRLALPVMHLAFFAAAAALVGDWMYRWALGAQVMFYGAALIGYAQRHAERRSFVFSVPCALCLLCWATVVGFIRFLTRRQQVTWERVIEPSEISS